jgi:membrane associated rhomboid family serine protease
MLEDRDYMRQPAYHEPRISFTVALLIVNAVVFVIQLISANFPNGQEIQDNYFALSLHGFNDSGGLAHGFVWQLFTFQFMHAGWMHLIFNSLAIFFFGRSVETVLGSRRFLAAYFSSGIIGGAVQMLFAFCLPGYFGGAVIGASAGAYGLVAAFAVINWTERFTLLIYFIPVTMRGRTLFLGSIIFTIIYGLIPNSGVANAAHLGGILTGFFYVRQVVQGRWPQWESPSRRAKPRELAAAGNGKNKFRNSAAETVEEPSTDEFLKNEVDPILEKISAKGIQSLTARERETLEHARAKMAKR